MSVAVPKTICILLGFLLAVLGATSAIDPIYDENNKEIISRGTVAAGYQNFFICIEMFFGNS